MTTVPPVGMAEEVIEQENLDAVEATTGKRRRRRVREAIDGVPQADLGEEKVQQQQAQQQQQAGPVPKDGAPC